MTTPTHGPAFEHSPVPALVYGIDGTPRSANLAYRTLAGLGPTDALGLGVWDVLHPDDRSLVLDGWQAFCRNESPRTPPEVRIRAAGDVWYWMMIIATVLPDHDELAVTLIDVTARHEALRYTEALLDQSADIIAVVAEDGTEVHVSSPWRANLGYPDDFDPVGGMFSLVHPDDVPRAIEAWRALLDGCLDRSVPVELRIVTAHGDYRRFDALFVDRRTDPVVAGVVVSGRDITERHAVSAKLAASEARYAGLVNRMQEGLWCIDPAGATTFTNPRMAEMLDTTPDAMLDTPLLDWVVPELRAETIDLLATRRDGLTAVHEMTFQRTDGTRLDALVAAAPTMRDGEMVEAVGVVTDISALKATEARLDSALHAAEQANATKTVFLSHVSHELRTPLNGILGYAYLLSRHSDETVTRYAEQIEHGGLHLERLIGDLLEITRLESGHLALHLGDVVLDEVVRHAGALAAVPSHRLSIHVDALAVVADPARLTQVFVNLLANALIHGPADGYITVRADQHDDRVTVRVCDQGPGIDPTDAERLFHPFVQLEPGTGSRQSGSGLGLAICAGLVEAMGGTIAVEPATTTCFAVDLPAATPVGPDNDSVPDHEPAVVLVVEDDRASCRLLEDIFAARTGAEVMSSGSIQEADARLAERIPRAVLLDISLPDGSGIDALRRWRATPATAQIPVIIITADTDPLLRSAALAAGADAFVTKPYRIPELLDLVSRSIAKAPEPSTSQ